jgi:16S rRNA (cytidine1402-2'-O)-methyltransferase
MLYLVSTPIGNLSDITLRALAVLRDCHYILCEDTRTSSILLRHYQIEKKLVSYHQFNEQATLKKIVADLKNGLTLCLISDAGTPTISDPGYLLVKQCVQEQIAFTSIPGPCALIQALCCSGFDSTHFQFCGFLPRKESELKKTFLSILSYEGTSICYESPHRLLKVLAMIEQIAPNRQLAVGREMTKKFEEMLRGTAIELINHFKSHSLKGEIVLLFSPAKVEDNPADWSDLSPEEHVRWFEEQYKINRKEAIKQVASLRAIPKREIYKKMIDQG